MIPAVIQQAKEKAASTKESWERGAIFAQAKTARAGESAESAMAWEIAAESAVIAAKAAEASEVATRAWELAEIEVRAAWERALEATKRFNINDDEE